MGSTSRIPVLPIKVSFPTRLIEVWCSSNAVHPNYSSNVLKQLLSCWCVTSVGLADTILLHQQHCVCLFLAVFGSVNGPFRVHTADKALLISAPIHPIVLFMVGECCYTRVTCHKLYHLRLHLLLGSGQMHSFLSMSKPFLLSTSLAGYFNYLFFLDTNSFPTAAEVEPLYEDKIRTPLIRTLLWVPAVHKTASEMWTPH